MSADRNIVDEETAERNRTVGFPGGYTFHAPLDCEPGETAFTIAAVRIGDHAHIHVESGVARDERPASKRGDRMKATRGHAGNLTLAWRDWLVLRDILAVDGRCHVVEVENPTSAQALRYAGDRPT